MPEDDLVQDMGRVLMTAVRSERGTAYRRGAIAGIAFVVLFVAGFMTFGSTPDSDASIAKWEAYWRDSGHRTTAIIGGYLIALSVLAFVWFVVSFRQRLVDARPDDRLPATVALSSGLVFSALVLVAITIGISVPAAKELGNGALPSGELSRYVDGLGIAILLLPGLLSAALFVGSSSLAIRGTDVLPRWLVIAGYVVAVLLLLGVFFIPLLLLMLWVLTTSIVLLARSRSAVAAA
jgi:hypothetical protein